MLAHLFDGEGAFGFVVDHRPREVPDADAVGVDGAGDADSDVFADAISSDGTNDDGHLIGGDDPVVVGPAVGDFDDGGVGVGVVDDGAGDAAADNGDGDDGDSCGQQR